MLQPRSCVGSSLTCSPRCRHVGYRTLRLPGEQGRWQSVLPSAREKPRAAMQSSAQSQLCVRLFIISDCISSGNLFPGCVTQRGNATRCFPGTGLLKRALLVPAPQDRGARQEIPTEPVAEWFLHLLGNAAVCVLSLGESGASTQLRGFFVTFLQQDADSSTSPH